jgi:hypothetical protein
MSIIRIVHKECLRKKTKRYVYNKNSTQGMRTKETKRYVYNKNSTQGMFTKEDEKVGLNI